ncbi:Hypothetical protein A7982_00453 [Minicystis rosea]|nr:Hypothetical protein A7982_00453 [Minicystis rosea]
MLKDLTRGDLHVYQPVSVAGRCCNRMRQWPPSSMRDWKLISGLRSEG